MSWARPAVVGAAPGARCAHTFTVCGNSMVAFGGWDGKKMLNDVYILRRDAEQRFYWTRSSGAGGAGPSVRAGHVAAYCQEQDTLYVFGGGNGTQTFNDLHAFHVKSETWSTVESPATRGAAAASDGSGVPSPRSRCTLTWLESERVLVLLFGGNDRQLFDDVFVFDVRRAAWRGQPTSGTPPCARWGHSTTRYGTRLYVFGGHDSRTGMLNDVHVLDTATWRWSQPVAAAAPAPPPRAGHSAILMAGAQIVVFGGGDGQSLLNDTWALDLATAQWTRPLTAGTPPSARCAHTALAVGPKASQMVVFGGSDGNRRFKDVYVLDIRRLVDRHLLDDDDDEDDDEQQDQPPRRNASLRRSREQAAAGATSSTSTSTSNNKSIRSSSSSSSSSAQSKTTTTPISANSSPATKVRGAAVNRRSMEQQRKQQLQEQQRQQPQQQTPPTTPAATPTAAASPKNQREKTRPSRRERDLKVFLDQCQLSHCFDRFVAEEIFLDTLPLCSEDHLRQLGVTTMGARIRLMSALQKHRPPSSSPPPLPPAAEPSSPSAAAAAATTTTPVSPELLKLLSESMEELNRNTARLSELVLSSPNEDDPGHDATE